MIEDILKKLGFNEKEATIYLAILKSGRILPADLAKTTAINRTTVYSVVKELIRKGVISEDLGQENLYLVARPPQDLNSLLVKEQKELDQKRDLIGKAIAELNNLSKNTRYSIPKIVFIGEDELENYLYKQTPVWNKSMRDKDPCWWGFQDKSFVRHYERWIDWYWETATPKEIKLKLLSNEEAEDLKNKKFPNRKIKFWKDGDFSSTLWINGDYLIMIVTSQRPHYLVEIHDTVLAHNMRDVFRGIWKSV